MTVMRPQGGAVAVSQRRHQRSSAAPAPAAPSGIDVTRNKRRLVAMVLVAVMWWVLLGTLAFLTANPVTLNRGQIQHAPVLITGVVEDLAAGKVRVEKHWRGADRAETVTIENLRAAGARGGDAYLFPLEPTSQGRFRVVPSPLPNHQPLIYPAGAETAQQLDDILKSPPETEPKLQPAAGSRT